MTAEHHANRHFAESTTYSITQLLNTGRFDRPEHDVMTRAGIVYLLVLLHDLLQLASAAGKRVGFTDDVGVVHGTPKDVTSLVATVRAAACHITSDKHQAGGMRLSLNILIGRVPNAFVDEASGTVVGSDYPDDWAVNFGAYRIYFRRHILRAFEEAQDALQVRDWCR